jgi:hypothetical protein
MLLWSGQVVSTLGSRISALAVDTASATVRQAPHVDGVRPAG